METQLVKKGDLNTYLKEQMTKQKQAISDLEVVIPRVSDTSFRKLLISRLTRSKECLVALEAGFVPVDGGWFWKTDTKYYWQKKQVKAVVDTMPEEVMSAWERVKELGIFPSFGVQGSRQGDPLLVGNKGGKHFLIASWINFEGGHAVGFIVKAAR